MTDRELLELAAKACGYDISHHWNALRAEMKPPVAALCIDSVSTAWDPLNDDGHALRLAVKLGVAIYPPDDEGSGATTSIQETYGGGWIVEDDDDRSDPFAATRRAIVRAAAEIGKAMP